MFSKLKERISDLEHESRLAKIYIESLKRRADEAERKHKDVERAFRGILDYMGVDWSIPGPIKLVKKGGPEEGA